MKSARCIFSFLKHNYTKGFCKKSAWPLDFMGASASTAIVKLPLIRLAMKIIMPILF